MNTEELMKNTDLEKIAREGSLIYEDIRAKYENDHKGEFLAIEIDSREEFLAGTSAEAMVQARAAHPNKVFYVVKIGADAVETMAHLFPEK